MYPSLPEDIFPGKAEAPGATSMDQSSDANSDDAGTVRELYLLMPEKYDDSSRAEREEILGYSEATVDIPHGYISYITHLSGEVFEAALFKAPDGTRILAYNQDSDPRYNVPTKLYFLRYEGGQWTDVTAQLFPVIDFWSAVPTCRDRRFPTEATSRARFASKVGEADE